MDGGLVFSRGEGALDSFDYPLCCSFPHLFPHTDQELIQVQNLQYNDSDLHNLSLLSSRHPPH